MSTSTATLGRGRPRGQATLQAIAQRAQEQLAQASAAEALAWTAQTFGDRWIVASNMQDAVLVDLAYRARRDIDVLFLDTGYHFVETLGTRDGVAVAYPEIRIIDARAEQPVVEQEAEFGLLNRTDPSRCCHYEKSCRCTRRWPTTRHG